MKFFSLFLLLLNFSFAQFDTITYNTKSEEILKTFDIEPDFLNDEYFINVKNNFLTDMRQERLLEKFQEGYNFIPTLKEMFLKENIPQEFLYLAMIESEFSLSAKSSKQAVGMWQFIPTTARSLGLEINTQIDERKDPIKSTQAAITYLKTLKQNFGKWYLAAIAYNCGEGRLRRAIATAGSDSLAILLDPNAKYIPLESRMYIRKILSVSLLFHNINTLKTKDYDYFLNRGATSILTSIEVPPATPLSQIANQAGLSLKELKQYNPHFKKNFTPTKAKTYTIHFPYKFLASYKEKSANQQMPLSFLIHRVNKGDTISSIAKRYGVSLKTITQYNAIKNANSLSINQEIIIPINKG
ncbi:LysM peptidoglycan-binding domain-containing protein [Helicobacter apodemus]|uniref:LysM peptidoglycan-binding domain-containing protein n=1 Tax=Helicobacter apodemus TaxID=135569 RepID=A0A4U8UEE3_9HELI|nr:lytic transglycosylase domain-containing protein [Helicobacter apodemus]MDE6959151.1 transglycosylase SLT domain-containing protein [Helicobacter apodemus]TLE16048.1 LysM peptidoglycan-binding domain-containing protein [Helicobacter apodemus]